MKSLYTSEVSVTVELARVWPNKWSLNEVFEQNGGTYTVENDYLIPNLIAPDQKDYSSGIWAIRHLSYLKNHRRVLYVNLLTSGRLADHLREIDTAANELWVNTVSQMAEAQGITEQLKVEKSME